ncbi:chloride ion current inducer protein, partial [Aphelenchoides avenae]
MLVLQNVQEPTENVRWAQHQVGAFWERQMLGQGSLILTDSKVVWISESTRTGFVLTYPAIAVHAAASANEEFPEPHLFLMVDASKTDVNYTPDRTDVEEEDDEDDVKTASVRFVPADSSV